MLILFQSIYRALKYCFYSLSLWMTFYLFLVKVIYKNDIYTLFEEMSKNVSNVLYYSIFVIYFMYYLYDIKKHQTPWHLKLAGFLLGIPVLYVAHLAAMVLTACSTGSVCL